MQRPNSISRTVSRYVFGSGCLTKLSELIQERKEIGKSHALFVIDNYFRGRDTFNAYIGEGDQVLYVDTVHEPHVEDVDALYAAALKHSSSQPSIVIGIGGGCAMDSAKAVSNLLGNGGKAADYQGWDLLKKPGVFKVGVPTVSGTGAEASRTCVLMNTAKNIKLGMNSDFTIFDAIVLDPDLTKTVPRNQYFYTGMDTYIHDIESSLNKERHVLADSLSRESINLCKEVFLSQEDMQSDLNRERMMIASYMGGIAMANSSTGVVHPLSYGLSMVFKVHHGVANCIIMNIMDEFYPEQTIEFREMVKKNKIEIPKINAKSLSEEKRNDIYRSCIANEKPLTAALGKDYKSILSKEKVLSLYDRL